MNRILVVGLLAATAAAHAQVPAQPGVQLYGLIDLSVEHLNHVGPARDSLTRVPSLGSSLPSRWGIRGSEDLGGGQRAVFTLESGFAPDSGASNQGGRLFGRQAWAGLAGGWGTLMLGRQYSMYYLSMQDAGILGPNLYGLGSLDPYIPTARFDNTVGYIGRFSGITLGAAYSLGRDVAAAPGGTNCPGENAADSQACRAASVMLKYDQANWGVAAAWDRQKGGTGASAGLTSSALSDTRKNINAYVKFHGIKLAGGLVRRDNEGGLPGLRRSDLSYIEAAWQFAPALSLEGQVARLDYKDSANDATLVSLRTSYALSKRTVLYATAGHINNDGSMGISASGGQPGGAPAAGGTQTGVALGVRHAF